MSPHSGPLSIGAVLDAAHAAFTRGRFDAALSLAFSGLNRVRIAMPTTAWRSAVQHVAAPHPLRAVVLEDPMTRRAKEKPRGYAGDAVLLDYMYRLRQEDLAHVSDNARRVHRFLVEGPAPCAVRHRLAVLADALAGACGPERPRRVLALASGHLRELALVPAHSRPREVVAFDQDEASLAVVASSYRAGVTTRRGTVREVLAGRLRGERFDLVYAAGLFDYLDRPVAAALASRMLELLAPAGRLLIANFTPETPDIGFMEAMSEWHLVYRTEADLLAIVDAERRRATGARVRTWRDPLRCIAYLEVEAPRWHGYA